MHRANDIEVIVEMDGEIRDAANLADKLQRPLETDNVSEEIEAV